MDMRMSCVRANEENEGSMSIKKKIAFVCLTALTAALMMPAAAFAAEAWEPNFKETGGVVKWDSPTSTPTTFTLKVENKDHSEIWFNATPGGAEAIGSFNIEDFLDSMAAPDGTYLLRIWPQNGYDPKTYDYVYSSLNGTLETPKNLKWNGYVMTWDSVPNAAKYYLEIYRNGNLDSANGYKREAPSNQVAIDTSRFSPGDKISFRVRAMNPAAGYGNSLWSPKSDDTVYGSVSEVTLSFDANGGSGVMDSRTGAPGSIVFGGAECDFIAPDDGKEFDCWELPDGQKLLGHESLTVYGDTKLKALWKDAPNPGSGSGQGGNGESGDQGDGEPGDGSDVPGNGDAPEGNDGAEGGKFEQPSDDAEVGNGTDPEGNQAVKPAAGDSAKAKGSIPQTGDGMLATSLAAVVAAAIGMAFSLKRKFV